MFQLANLVSRYTLEVRTSKEPFVIGTFFGIIQEAAVDIRSESKDLLGVEVILHNLKQKLLPAPTAAMEPENVIKGEILSEHVAVWTEIDRPLNAVTYEEPWIVRATEMHRNAARDEEAERKVIKLTEDIRDLSRELRLKVIDSRPSRT
jgi:dynactin 1